MPVQNHDVSFNHTIRSEARVHLQAMATDIDMLIGHACSVERANKEQKFITGITRTKLSPDRIQKLLYVYMNGKRMSGIKLSFEQCAQLFLSKEEADSILDALFVPEHVQPLPLSEEMDEESQPESDSEDEDEGCLRTYQIPEGLRFLPKPDDLPEGDRSDDGRISGLFVISMFEYKCKEEHIWAWYVGRVLKFNKNRRYNYTITWDDTGPLDQSFRLENYKEAGPGLEEEVVQFQAGYQNRPLQTWAFLTKGV